MTLLPRALLSAAFVFAAACVASADEPAFIPNQALVRLTPGATIAGFNARYSTTTVDSITPRNIHLVALPVSVDEITFRDSLSVDAEVISAELNYVADEQPPGGSTQSLFFRVARVTYLNDPTPGVVQASLAWPLGRGQGVTVAVLDTGIDATHPELFGRVAPGGTNFVNPGTPPTDVPAGLDTDNDARFDEFVGHGTLVAGLVARVAPDAKILPIKVMDSDGVATTFRAIAGIYHALDHGADVINLSLGTLADPALLKNALVEAESRGVVVVASAGNENDANPRFPAAFPAPAGTIAVGATHGSLLRADFSNYGAWITLCAPGVDVVSTLPNNEYARASGTSFAAPLIAGAAAVLRSGCNLVGAAEVRALLAQGATPIDAANPSYAGLLGAGRVDAGASANAASSAGALVVLADFNGDRVVNVADLTFMLGRFGQTAVPGSLAYRADLDHDGVVNTPDLVVFLGDFGSSCP
ncbi:MAG: S8 family serine peptidase [Phycisphaerales bacterium]